MMKDWFQFEDCRFHNITFIKIVLNEKKIVIKFQFLILPFSLSLSVSFFVISTAWIACYDCKIS